MDFGEPIAEGTLNITSVAVAQGTTTLNYEGDVGKFGRVFVTHDWTSGSDGRESYEVTGSARGLQEDGNVISATLHGLGRRSNNVVKLFTLDAVSNGDQVLVVADVDILKKTANVTVYSLW